MEEEEEEDTCGGVTEGPPRGVMYIDMCVCVCLWGGSRSVRRKGEGRNVCMGL
jgi:hypothetical protein